MYTMVQPICSSSARLTDVAPKRASVSASLLRTLTKALLQQALEFNSGLELPYLCMCIFEVLVSS